MWWKLTFDVEGGLVNTEVRRATVRVRVATSYEVITTILADHDGATNHEATNHEAASAEGVGVSAQSIDLQDPGSDALGPAAKRGIDLVEVATSLRDFGSLRLSIQADRGGVSLQLPEQDVQVDASGNVQLLATPSLPAEEWNAQMSLATGMAAAALMLTSKPAYSARSPAPSLKFSPSCDGRPRPSATDGPLTTMPPQAAPTTCTANGFGRLIRPPRSGPRSCSAPPRGCAARGMQRFTVNPPN